MRNRVEAAACALLAAAAALEISCFCLAVAAAQPVGGAPSPEAVEVRDEPSEEPPLYLQTDERWGGLPYAGADLATAGCGLTCAAMAWEHLSGDECTPAMLLDAVGDSFVQEGQNYMPGFCEWMGRQDPTLDYTVIYESRERALAEAADGRMVFGSMSGRLYENGTEYGGHIVLINGFTDGLVTVNDPCTPQKVRLSRDDFDAVTWRYFISIGRN